MTSLKASRRERGGRRSLLSALIVLLLLAPASLEIHHSCHSQLGPPHAGDASTLRQERGGSGDLQVQDLCNSCALLRTLLADGGDDTSCDASPVFSAGTVPAAKPAARSRTEGVPQPRGPPSPELLLVV